MAGHESMCALLDPPSGVFMIGKPCLLTELVRLHAGPELGPLAGLMVGPEQGGWQVDEITVVSSRTGHVDRYAPPALPALPAGKLSPCVHCCVVARLLLSQFRVCWCLLVLFCVLSSHRQP